MTIKFNKEIFAICGLGKIAMLTVRRCYYYHNHRAFTAYGQVMLQRIYNICLATDTPPLYRDTTLSCSKYNFRPMKHLWIW